MNPSRSSNRLTRSSDIGRLIAEGRRRAKLSQTEFATQLGVSRKTISDIERGAAEHLSMNTALAALWLAGFQLEVHQRRPPTLAEVMGRRAADIARAEQLEKPSPSKDRKR